MKKLLLLCCGLLLGSGLYAQQIEGYNFSVAFGYTIPVGSFASSDWKSNGSGLANNGLSLDLAYNYTPDRTFGLTGGLYFSNLTTNDTSISSRLESMMGKLLNRTITDQDRRKINYESNDWRWGSVLIGPRLVLPCGKGVFDAKILSGVQYTYLPYQQMVLKNTDNRTYNIETADKNKFSLPFRFSTSYSCPIQNKISFKIQADYYRANTSYDLNEQIINESSQQLVNPTAVESYKIHIQTVSIGVGLVYDLN